METVTESRKQIGLGIARYYWMPLSLFVFGFTELFIIRIIQPATFGVMALLASGVLTIMLTMIRLRGLI